MNNFHYFGLFLDTDTKNRLMDILTDNIDYNIALGVADRIFIDHCTLLHVSNGHYWSPETCSPHEDGRGAEGKSRQRRSYSDRCNDCSYACYNYEGRI